MAAITRVGSLEVSQDLGFQRYQWTTQRWAWLALLLLMAAALLGLLGHGPLSSMTAGDPGGPLHVEYDRFLRRSDQESLYIQIGPATTSDGTVRLWLDRDYLRKVCLEQVTPPPERSEAGPDRHVFVFRVVDPGAATLVTFHFEPRQIGPLRGRMGLGDGPALAFDQFVYP
jgi:hypothetical protein